MKARIEEDVFTDRLKVWLYLDGAPVQLLRLAADGPPTYVAVLDGETPRPTLTIPRRALEALLREAQGFVPASDATTAHLNDAMSVRDRLLALVERLT